MCDRFLESIAIPPQNWQWQAIDPMELVHNLNTNNGLVYQAIPSILATLLHEKECIIHHQNGEQTIRWRKVQGSAGSRSGLFLVSYPFRAEYINNNGDSRDGYFAYRLEFHVQTQAGRLNEFEALNPWIFLKLSCQRYAHEPISKTNFDRNTSILMGMNEAQLTGYDVDSTLVKLVVNNSGSGDRRYWQYQLPKLLSAFKARDLAEPQAIFDNPRSYANFDNQQVAFKDEYYVIHSEGYKYKPEKHHRNHSLKTGFSLKEIGNIMSEVLGLLNGTLVPDKALSSDRPTPDLRTGLWALGDYKKFSKVSTLSEKGYQKRKKMALDAVNRGTSGETIHLFIIYYEKITHDHLLAQIREVLLLEKGEEIPNIIKIHEIQINDSNLLQPLENNLAITGVEFYRLMKNQYQHKCRVWRTFLQEKIPNDTRNRLAFVEIGKRKGIRPEQSIYGAVREACALEGISSQMIQTINSTESSLKRNDPPYRVLQATLDLTLRQLGILYGQPLEVYKKAGIPTQIAQSLDIIALCRLQEQSQDVHYAIAVRLQATGLVEVMLPSVREWIPYHQAGVAIGKIFSQARGNNKNNHGKRIDSDIKLKGAELVEFAAYITTQKLERPTIVFIEADVWRNERGQDNDSKIWPQLKNDQLYNKQDILDFSHVFGHNCKYQRNDAELNNLLAVIRLRSGRETPQYIPDRETWNDDTSPRDFQHLVGFYDDSTSNMLHYFSIGRLPKTQKQQATRKFDLYMLDEHDDGESGAAIAFKHQQILEMVPFFIRTDLQTKDATLSLCRCLHYLRTSPAWSMGNISRPYPMYLGHKLINDQICILGT